MRLGDIATRKNEIADRLNLVDEEQGIFTGHVGDLNSKNQVAIWGLLPCSLCRLRRAQEVGADSHGVLRLRTRPRRARSPR